MRDTDTYFLLWIWLASVIFGKGGGYFLATRQSQEPAQNPTGKFNSGRGGGGNNSGGGVLETAVIPNGCSEFFPTEDLLENPPPPSALQSGLI